MKKLFIVRHAEAETKMVQPDYERALNQRGETEALKVAQQLKEKNVLPGRLLCSHAVRSRQTAEIIARQLDYPLDRLVTERGIYQGSVEDLLDIVQNQPDDAASMMMVGHNPSISELADSIAESYSRSMPTAGVVAITFFAENWQEVRPGAQHWLDFSLKP